MSLLSFAANNLGFGTTHVDTAAVSLKTIRPPLAREVTVILNVRGISRSRFKRVLVPRATLKGLRWTSQTHPREKTWRLEGSMPSTVWGISSQALIDRLSTFH